jgi:hypothetical protein
MRTTAMLDRQKVESILLRRFPGSTRDQVAAAANSIMGLSDEWVEVLHDDQLFGYHYSSECGNICYLAREVEDGTEFRLFLRRAEA